MVKATKEFINNLETTGTGILKECVTFRELINMKDEDLIKIKMAKSFIDDIEKFVLKAAEVVDKQTKDIETLVERNKKIEYQIDILETQNREILKKLEDIQKQWK